MRAPIQQGDADGPAYEPAVIKTVQRVWTWWVSAVSCVVQDITERIEHNRGVALLGGLAT